MKGAQTAAQHFVEEAKLKKNLKGSEIKAEAWPTHLVDVELSTIWPEYERKEPGVRSQLHAGEPIESK